MTEEKYIVANGLLPLPEDKRDFSMGALFDQPDIKDLPEYFELDDQFAVEDQRQTDFCTGYGTTHASQLQEGIRLDELYQMSRIKELSGDWKSWGADLRKAMQAGAKVGFLPKELSPFGLDRGRDFLANWVNWPDHLKTKAAPQQKQTYFAVDGRYDIFDNIKTRIWQFREEKRAIVTGALWREEWTYAMRGIIPESYASAGSGHCFIIVGFKKINGNEVLKIKNSFGKQYGDDGYFYMTRKVVNRELTFGNFMYKDLPAGETKESAVVRSADYRWQQLSIPVRLWEILKEVLVFAGRKMGELRK